ncbi:hypothetical protein EXS70_00610 [Candidatus Peribacteria bacterium]|nr:hypothetical protein [Candidatus Peribacteria bacterium]
MTAQITIDVSQFPATESGNFESILNWVRAQPSHSSIHVYYRNRMTAPLPRRFQTVLQALGCTVTRRVVCS